MIKHVRPADVAKVTEWTLAELIEPKFLVTNGTCLALNLVFSLCLDHGSVVLLEVV